MDNVRNPRRRESLIAIPLLTASVVVITLIIIIIIVIVIVIIGRRALEITERADSATPASGGLRRSLPSSASRSELVGGA